jgi:release factor glutamine methyltransferase
VALGYARANAARLAMADRAELRLGDWTAEVEGTFDLMLCNPPYIAEGAELGLGVAEYEPQQALYAGADGLDCYRRLAPEVARLLAFGGIALFEIGHDQAESAGALFRAQGWEPRLLKDLGGRPRCLLLCNAERNPLELAG